MSLKSAIKWNTEHSEERKRRTREYQRLYQSRPEYAEYKKKYYQDHKEERKAYRRKYYKDNPSRVKKDVHERYGTYREMFLEMYGRCCSCCGESTKEFLTIDHVKGQSKTALNGKSRDTTNEAYRKACREHRPDLYRILCMNCNHSYGIRGYCPHQKTTEKETGQNRGIDVCHVPN